MFHKRIKPMKYITKSIAPVLFFIISIILTGCNGGEMEEKHTVYSNINNIPAAAWEKLSEKKIYFGHQSVGFNIIDGINAFIKEYPQIKLNIVETNKLAGFKRGVFAHSRIGKNCEPETKFDEFNQLIKTELGQQSDIAALKCCYVDVTGKTEVKKTFNDYVKIIAEIKEKYPEINIIHFTVPLTTTKITWKTKLKTILGKKEIWEYDDNIKRNQYNARLVEKYKGIEPIFDIAKIESTNPDGTRSTFQKDKKTYFAMSPEYTDDGGHLNKTGQKIVAEQFLLLLVNL